MDKPLPKYYGNKSVIFQKMKSKNAKKKLVETVAKMKRKKMIMVKLKAVRVLARQRLMFKIKEEKP